MQVLLNAVHPILHATHQLTSVLLRVRTTYTAGLGHDRGLGSQTAVQRQRGGVRENLLILLLWVSPRTGQP
jgi:hypothetical protein